MKIGIDMDSVLNDLDEHWAAWIRANGDPDFAVSKWTTWDVHDHTTIGKKAYDYLMLPGTFRGLRVRTHAQRVVHDLVRQGHDVLVVTSTIPESWVDKTTWLREHFPFIPKDNLIACSRKGLLNLDILLDDGLHNFKDFGGQGVVFDRPWNRNPSGHVLYRAYDWLHFQELMMPAQFRPCGCGDTCGPLAGDHTQLIREAADRMANTP